MQQLSPELAILSALLGGAQHGYAIMQWVREWSDGESILGPATLYTAVKRLVRSGYIVVVAEDQRRTTYAITPEGIRHLEEETLRLERLARRMRTLFTPLLVAA
jgi:DNA-binding PadR family transcriptional regulator